jgi:predicted DNA-binding transcriptional regulator YafY
MADHLEGEAWEIGDDAASTARFRAARQVPAAAVAFASPLREEEEGVLYEAPVRRASAFIAWVLGWGGLVEVVSPAALRQAVAAEAGRLASLYAEGADACGGNADLRGSPAEAGRTREIGIEGAAS